MAIGERIRFIRNLRGMTQKWLGIAVGFPEKTADVRMAQYEGGTRTPKADMINALANVLEVSPKALDVPDIDSYIGLMHTMFTLEDLYGLQISEDDGEVCLRVDKSKGTAAVEFHKMLCAWLQVNQQLKDGSIDKAEYDKWRYNYPEYDTSQRWVKVPSQGLSDMLVNELNKSDE
ncbi:MAG: helix-turn-helix domain-containing protein [Oscillospiraceae bacterium]|nr:helix-turn-helix domain-containing protein [Oscillospiraceae bacterium]